MSYSYSSISNLLITVFVIALCFLFFSQSASAFPEPPEESKCFLKKNADNKIIINNGTPNQKVLIVWGFKEGISPLLTTNCAGTELGIANGKKIARVKMNAEGNKKANVKVPSTAENTGYIQMVDLSTCTAGPVVDTVFTAGQIPNGKGCTYDFEGELDSCPCFDASNIEGQGIDFDAESLSMVSCSDTFPNGVFMTGDRPGEFTWDAASFDDINGQECSLNDSENGISPNAFDLNDAQYLDCQNIILNSQMWNLNCVDD